MRRVSILAGRPHPHPGEPMAEACSIHRICISGMPWGYPPWVPTYSHIVYTFFWSFVYSFHFRRRENLGFTTYLARTAPLGFKRELARRFILGFTFSVARNCDTGFHFGTGSQRSDGFKSKLGSQRFYRFQTSSGSQA